MLIKRQLELETSNLNVGDVIWFTLEDGEQVEAMAMKKEGTDMIFAFMDCIEEERPMIDSDGVTLAEWMNDKLLKRLPREMIKNLVAFEDGTYLRLMTQKEVFGQNEWCDDEPEDATQFEPMKDRRNRIADRGYRGLCEKYEWYWLSNRLRDVVSAATFASVDSNGNASSGNASVTFGVRPAFKLSQI